MRNWNSVKALSPLEKALSEALFGLVSEKGRSGAEVVFSGRLEYEYVTDIDGGTVHLELNARYRSYGLADLLKFVRFVSCVLSGDPYVPDVHCFGGRICPYPRGQPGTPREQFRRVCPEDSAYIRWTPEGRHRNLLDSVQRLLDSGLLMIDDVMDSCFVWTDEKTDVRLGYCNSSTGLVAINSVYDRPEVPDKVVDLLVYHECLHLRQRMYDWSGGLEDYHDEEFRGWESRYPDYERMKILVQEYASPGL